MLAYCTFENDRQQKISNVVGIIDRLIGTERIVGQITEPQLSHLNCSTFTCVHEEV